MTYRKKYMCSKHKKIVQFAKKYIIFLVNRCTEIDEIYCVYSENTSFNLYHAESWGRIKSWITMATLY